MKTQLKKSLKLIKEYEAPMSTVLGMVTVIVFIGGFIYGVRFLPQSDTTFTPDFSLLNSPSPMEIPVVSQLPTSVFVYEKNGQYFVENLPVAYIVQQGDSLTKVSTAFYRSADNVSDIAVVNGIASDSALNVNQTLLIPDVPTRMAKEIIEREKKN